MLNICLNVGTSSHIGLMPDRLAYDEHLQPSTYSDGTFLTKQRTDQLKGAGDLRAHFGSVLRALRGNVSQAALADETKLGQAYLSRLERGTQTPGRRNTIERLADGLAKLHEKSRDAFFDELDKAAAQGLEAAKTFKNPLSTMGVEADQDQQRLAQKETWVVATTPLELADANYRDLVAEKISSDKNPLNYVYWSPSPDNLERLYKLLFNSLQHKCPHLAARDREAILTERVKFVVTPPSAAWFSVVLYDAKQAYSTVKTHLAYEARGGDPTGIIFAITDTANAARILEDLRTVHSELFELTKNEYRDRSGALWKRYSVLSLLRDKETSE